MKSKNLDVRAGILVMLIFLAAFSRLIPHMLNFSPLGAIGLFGAAYFTRKWQAFLVPLAATWLSDLFLNNVIYVQAGQSFTWFDDGFYWMYGSYVLITIAALFIFRKVNAPRIFAGALVSTAIFFLVTNLASFLNNPIYPHNIGGLISCYAAGIPFLKGTLFGDVFYSGVLFGTFALLQQRFHSLQPATARKESF